MWAGPGRRASPQLGPLSKTVPGLRLLTGYTPKPTPLGPTLRPLPPGPIDSRASPPASPRHVVSLLLLRPSLHFLPPDSASRCLLGPDYPFPNVLPPGLLWPPRVRFSVISQEGEGTLSLPCSSSPSLSLPVALLTLLNCGWSLHLYGPGRP